jgi:hypothetical protein
MTETTSWHFFPDFYTKLLTTDHGTQVRNERGCRPRGTYTRGTPGQLELMIVFQNPGTPVPEVEWNLESDQPAIRDLSKRLWDLSGSVWSGEYYSRTYAIARKEMAYLLNCTETDVIKRVIFTNVVRSTPPQNITFSEDTLRIGSDLLAEEIKLWNPRRVIAYGRVAAKVMNQHNIRVNAEIPHPAALGKWLNSRVRCNYLDTIRHLLA